MPIRHKFAVCILCLLPIAAELNAQLRSEEDTHALSLPAVGDCTLRILSPSILELTRISSEAKGAPLVPDFRIIVGGHDAAIAAVGSKRRVAYAPLARRDLRIATQFYIRVAHDIALEDAGQLVEVRDAGQPAGNPSKAATAACDPLRYSPVIHVNQEGYVPALPKKAMIGYYLGDMGELDIPVAAGFEIIDARSGKVVFSGELTFRRDIGYRTSPAPYQKVAVADFSEFRIPGEYRLWIPGLGASAPFLINDGIAMGFTRTYALGLYQQRCGTSNDLPFTRFVHGACHVERAQIPVESDPQFAFTWATIAGYAGTANTDNPPQSAPPLTSEARQLYPFVRTGSVDVSGGHHDAGDYSRYTINSAELIHYLVFTVDSIPGAAGLDNLGIPESGDGIGDILQEAKWEADYIAKLQDTDGGFYFLVYPKGREYESDVLPDHGDSQVVWPKNTAATAAAVAALAQCASSPEFKRHYPSAAAQYLKQAELGWQFLMNAVSRHGKAGAYQKITFYGDRYTHDDEFAWAACELFLATGNIQFQKRLFEWFPNPASHITFRWGWWRMSESWGNAIRSYAFAARSGRLPVASLNPRYLKLCERQVVAAADDALDWSAKNAYATPFPLATKAVNGAGWYFSLDQASDMAVAYAVDPKPAYIDALTGAMNYEGGCNPVNVTYLTGLGVRRQREIVDQYAQNDRRLLPPSGIPIGNIQAAFQYMPKYSGELREATYPDDNAKVGPYPFYDRWSDAFNVTTEFIAVNQARALMASAFLAAHSEIEYRNWTHANAWIAAPDAPVQLNAPETVRLEVPGEDLAMARIVWEARDQEPAFGPTYTFSPKHSGPQWVEAEAEWPDGRRAFAIQSFRASGPAETWLDGAVPDGAAMESTGGDGWNWIAADPSPHSGPLSHQSNVASGLHQHSFTGATATLEVNPGDSLFAWVYVDPAHPPTEIMLAWNDGTSWEHRAYWGANKITFGTNGSPGRHRSGDLPPVGRWVQLRVSASAVGLEGARLSGMGFSLMDGRATWGAGGRER